MTESAVPKLTEVPALAGTPHANPLYPPDALPGPRQRRDYVLHCPAYLDARGTLRCALPVEIQDWYLITSTDGPLESARMRCPRGHWFNGPVESLTCGRNSLNCGVDRMTAEGRMG
jgi:hypothetical protein